MNSTPRQYQDMSADHIDIVDLNKAIQRFSATLRKYNLSYNQTKKVFAQVRQLSNIKRQTNKKSVLPVLPSQKDIETLLKAAEGNHTHWVIIQTLMTTGCRVSEIINIRIQDVYFDENKIFIHAGKTGDRYVLFPPELGVHFKVLAQGKAPDQTLFTSKQYKPFTRFGVSKFLSRYAKQCGIEKKIHPHIFRHYFCTRMSSVMSESEVMILSGHAKKDTLAIYQHLTVESLKAKYTEVYR